AQIRHIFLDGYGIWVFRIVIFKISSFKLQNACLLLTFTNYSIITAILKDKRLIKAETLKGVIINETSSAPAKGNKSSSASKVSSAPAKECEN
ncbi:hypothetical protein Tco_1056868, partial [Tanacetum coccineum]